MSHIFPLKFLTGPANLRDLMAGRHELIEHARTHKWRLPFSQIFKLPITHPLANLQIAFHERTRAGVQHGLNMCYLGKHEDTKFLITLRWQVIKKLDQHRKDKTALEQVKAFAEAFDLGPGVIKYAALLIGKLEAVKTAPPTPAGKIGLNMKTFRRMTEVDQTSDHDRWQAVEQSKFKFIIIVEDNVDAAESMRDVLAMHVEEVTGQAPETHCLNDITGSEGKVSDMLNSGKQHIITVSSAAEIAGVVDFINGAGKGIFDQALLLSDFNLGVGVTGGDVVRAARGGTKCVAIGMSGEAGLPKGGSITGNTTVFRRAGIDAFILKPVDPDILLQLFCSKN